MVSRTGEFRAPAFFQSGNQREKLMKTEEIAKEAEIDSTLLAVQRVQVWYPLNEEGMPVPAQWFADEKGGPPVCLPKPSVWTVGKVVPGEKDLVVLGLFSDSSEIRVYAVSVANKSPRRYTLSKTSPLIGVEFMSAELIKAEVLEEMQAQMGDDDAQEVVAAILETLREKGFAEAYTLIKDEYLDEEEEEEEEEEQETNGTAPTQPAPAVATEGPKF
jgi:hypothetical protein